MKPEEKFQEHIKALDELQDRMIKAGLIIRHAHSQKGAAAEFTPEGIDCVTTIAALNEVLGPLTHRQIIYLWDYFVEFSKARLKVRK